MAKLSSLTSELNTERVAYFGTLGLFYLILLLGGGGAPAPVPQAILSVLSLGWLLFLSWMHLFKRQIAGDSRVPMIILLVLFALPALHLVPLPYDLWAQLPGRETAAQALQLAGLRPGTMTLSLVPEGTRQAALQLLAPAAVVFGIAAVAPERRLQFVNPIIIVATISAIVGALQFSMPGTRALYLFPKSIFTTASGLFANRNFQSDFLLIAILLCGVKIKLLNRGSASAAANAAAKAKVIAFLVVPFLAFAVVATLSRTGFLLVAPVVITAYVLGYGLKLRRELLWLAGAAAVAGTLAVLFPPPLITSVLARFDRLEEIRVQVFSDLLFAAQLYSPFGAGIGTFDPVYRSVESLSVVRPTYLNHAHNDYLEIAIEAGWIGLALVVAFLLIFAWRSVQVMTRQGTSPYLWLQRIAVLGIAIVLIHSVVDYPLRTMTLQAVIGFMTVILFSRPPLRESAVPGARPLLPARLRRRPYRIGAAILLFGLGLLAAKETMAGALAQGLAASRIGQIAYQLQPSNNRAAALAASEMMLEGNALGAQRLALRALSRSPFDVVAIRTVGEARNRLRPGSGNELLLLAGRLGWRDRPTQAWILRQAVLAGDVDIAMQRAEALVRLENDSDLAYGILRYLAAAPDTRLVLARSLARRPFWRSAFLAVNGRIPPEQLAYSGLILLELAKTNSRPSMIEAAATIDGLAAADRWQEAFDLYSRLFPGRARGVLEGREEFQRPIDSYSRQRSSSVFDWQLGAGSQGGASIEEVAGEPGNRAVFSYSDGSAQGALLQRNTRLAPGTYRLAYRMHASSSDAPAALRWRIACLGQEPAESSTAPIPEGRWSIRSLSFTVPQGCEFQSIILAAVPPEDGEVREAYFDGIELRRQ